MTNETATPYDPDQAARAEALKDAKRLLGANGGMVATSLPEGRSTDDLADLAEFILDGTHPQVGRIIREQQAHPLRFTTGIQDVDLAPAPEFD